MKSGLAPWRPHRRIGAVRVSLIFTMVMLVGVARADATPELAAIVDAAPTCDDARPHCVEIRLHVAATDAGLVASAAWIHAQLATANRQFAPLGVSFQLAGGALLPAAAAHLRTRADRSALGAHLGGPVIHVFITGQLDNVDEPTVPVHGVAWRKGARKYLIVSASARDLVLAHELGHFFGLPHSTYAISIMNKTRRDEPPIEARTFADEEITRMRGVLKRLLRAAVIASVPPRRSPVR